MMKNEKQGREKIRGKKMIMTEDKQAQMFNKIKQKIEEDEDREEEKKSVKSLKKRRII